MTNQMKTPTRIMGTIKNNSKRRIIVTGLLAGVAVGTAILLALKSDNKDVLKQKVSDWFSDLFANSKDKLGMIGNLAKETLVKAKA